MSMNLAERGTQLSNRFGLREPIARPDDARALRRQIFDSEADLTPDPACNTLTVSLHYRTQGRLTIRASNTCWRNTMPRRRSSPARVSPSSSKSAHPDFTQVRSSDSGAITGL
jgi:hypothetical protein